jgi:Dna[CI] antecedent, DciA
MRRPGPRAVSHALDALTAGLAPATLLAEVQRAWPRAAPPVFHGRTEPRREQGGVIVVVCSEAVIANELQLLSERVRERLNEALGREAVTGLKPEVGTLAR